MVLTSVEGKFFILSAQNYAVPICQQTIKVRRLPQKNLHGATEETCHVSGSHNRVFLKTGKLVKQQWRPEVTRKESRDVYFTF